MTFLNGILAFGAAAAAIPLLIHLLNRSRFRTIEWGAMHLLESVVRVNNRRIRIEQWLLLLVRCAIPALLAFCLARPVLTGWRALPGDVPSSLVILLDNSYSMDAKTNGQTHLSAAVEHAGNLIEHLDRGSDVSLVETGGRPAPALDRPVFDIQLAIRQLRRLPGGYGPGRPAEALETGLGILAGMANARRHLVYISDFQRTDWIGASPASLAGLRAQIDAMPIRPSLTFLQVGREPSSNVAIESVDFSQTALGTGQDLHLRVNLRNRGEKSYPATRVTCRVDGKPDSAVEVNLPANAAAQALLTCSFAAAGSHVVQFEADSADSLETDNHYSVAVPVLERIEVLLVDGAPGSRPLEGETDFLAVALTPYTLGRVKLSDLIATRSLAPEKLAKESLGDARVVVLANVARLSDPQVGLLTDYVRGGGSVLVFLGGKVNLDWYNRALYSGAGLLPMRMAGLSEDLKEGVRGTRIVAQHFDHPALEAFNDRANGNLTDAEIRRWYRLGQIGDVNDAGGDSADQPPLVLARLETGDPLIVERRAGAGRVILVATACDADWSNLPMRPAYLPLMQQLVTTMACQAEPPRNIETGEPLVAILPGGAAGAALSLTSPAGARQTVRPTPRGTRSVVQFDRTGQPGVYTLTGPDSQPIHFVAEAPRSESDLSMLDAGEIAKLAEALGGRVVASSDEFLKLDRIERHGRETWRYLLAALLTLMFAELFLQQYFTRARA